MKVVVAIDSLKGSLSSIKAGMAIRDGVLAAKPDAEVIVKTLADGGEGTTDALIEGMNGKRIDLTVTGPMGTPVNAYYGYLADCHTAVMNGHPPLGSRSSRLQRKILFLLPATASAK